MYGFDLISLGLSYLFQPVNIVLCITGTFIGIIFGVIPGLTGTICLSLLLPLTYAMQSSQALVLLGAVYCGAVFGGAISAITLNIPGTPEAICTTFDGYRMAQKGQAGKAIGSAVEVSAFGGFVSVIVLIFLGPLVAMWALEFSSTEYFTLILMGLCCVSAITGKSLTKGLLSMFIGVLVCTIGMTPITGDTRFTFGSLYLTGRLEFIPVVIGVFAISEFFIRFEEKREIRGGYEAKSQWPSFRELWGIKSTIGISAVLGYICGAIPGLGSTLASFLGYGAARSYSRQGAQFGTGILEGVVAPETANNAATGGAMLPLLTMGIPGGTATAIMLGVLLLHGIEPGPNVFRANPDLIGAACGSMLLANILMLFMGFYLSRLFAGILRIQWGYLVAVILMFCFIGGFSLRSNFFDVYTMLIFGLIAYAMRKTNYPLAPFILGVILGHMLEEQFLRTMLRTGNSFLPFFTRPISLFFFIFALALLLFPLIKRGEIISGLKNAADTDPVGKGEFMGLLMVIGISIAAFIGAFEYKPPEKAVVNTGALWPWICSVSLIVLSVFRLSQARNIRDLLTFRGSWLTAKGKMAFIGGFWMALFVVAEAVLGHMVAPVVVLPFLLRFSGVKDIKFMWGVPIGLMIFTTILFTVWFYIALPTGWGIFHDIQRTILFQIESVVR